MNILETHLVPNETSSIRFIDYALTVFTDIPTKSAMKKAIKKSSFLIENKPIQTGTIIKAGQTIVRVDTEKVPEKFYRIDIQIVHEDEHIAIINKPAGIVVSGNSFKTIVNALPLHLSKSKEVDALNLFKPVHRLDAATSGLLIIAKTARSLALLGQMFEAKKIRKEYRAIVCGKIDKEASITSPIDGLQAWTSYQVIRSVPSLQNDTISLVRLSPHTGRTHQLRIHMATIGNPIMGDPLYGSQAHMLKGKGLFLCAVSLSFLHPISKIELKFSIDMPPKYDALLEREKKRWEKFNSNE